MTKDAKETTVTSGSALARLSAERRWAIKQNWHDLSLEGLGTPPADMVPLQERWANSEIDDWEFRQGVLELVRKTAPNWNPGLDSVLSRKRGE